MALAERTRTNPFVGPRTFRTGETLYGRDREVLELLDLMIAERIVLLYSPSGAGKSSLIQAALIPALEREGFSVLPVMRVSLEPRSAEDLGATNRYLLSALLSLEEELLTSRQMPLDELSKMDLASYLEHRRDVLTPDDGGNAVLIFDQFEEVLTVDPADQAAKSEFFSLIGAALRDRRYWALFAMREDYLAGLDPYLRAIPTRLRTTYRLDFLDEHAARLAMQMPVRNAGVAFTDSAAQALVDDLRSIRVQHMDGSVDFQLGPYVEPVQLQVVCHRLWSMLPDDAWKIGDDDVQAIGDVNTALSSYYADQVRAVARTTGVPERLIREWFDQQLITDQGIRGQVLRGTGESQGLSNRVIRLLQNAHLVRGEKRRGAIWYELSHDRLIDPIRSSNAAWREANLSLLQRQAGLWEREGRPSGVLLRAETLAEAERWAADHGDELTPIEGDFLAASQQASEQAARERRKNRIIYYLCIVAVIIAAVAGLLFIQARRESERANRETERANLETQRATLQATLASLRELLASASEQLEVDPELSVLLYREAVQTALGAQAANASSDSEGEVQQFVTQAQDGLAIALDANRVRATFDASDEDQTYGIAFHPDGAQVITAGNGGLSVWDAKSGAPQPAFGPGEDIYTTAFSPDGTRMATGAISGRIRVWDVISGAEVQSFQQGDGVWALAFSPDGSRLATGAVLGRVRVWSLNSPTDTPIVQFDDPGAANINSIVFSGDGSRIAIGFADGTARTWDVTSQSPIPQFIFTHTEGGAEVYQAAFNHDDTRLVTTGTDGVVKVWDAATGDPTPLRTVTHSSEEQWSIRAVFSADGSRLFTAGSDGLVKMWDIESSSEEPTRVVGSRGDFATTVAFDSDASLALTTNFQEGIKVWDLESSSNEPLEILREPAWIRDTAVAADGTRIVAMTELGMAKVWDLGAGSTEPSHTFWHPASVYDFTFSVDGALLATANMFNEVTILDAKSNEELLTLPHSYEVVAVAFSPDRSLVATGGYDGSTGTISVWDIASESTEPSYSSHCPNNWVNSVAFSPNGTWLAASCGTSDGTVRIWDITSGSDEPIHTFEADTRETYSIAFSSEGDWLATAGFDGVVKLWDTQGSFEDPILSFVHPSSINSIVFNPSSALLAAARSDGAITVWDIASEREIHLFAGHKSSVVDVAFSPDGKQLASMDYDGTSKVWDVATGTGHTGLINHIAYSVDGKLLATASFDHSAKVWDAPTGQELASLRHDNAVFGALFNEEGSQLATGTVDGFIRIWDVASGELLRTLPGHTPTISGFDLNLDWTTLAVADASWTVKLWDLGSESDEPAHTIGLDYNVIHLEFDPAGTRLATSGYDGVIRIWDVATGNEESTFKLEGDRLGSLLGFSPDGNALAILDDSGGAIVRDLASSQVVCSIKHTYFLNNLVFSRDGSKLATADVGGNISVWDVRSGCAEPLHTLHHAAAISSIDFAPDSPQGNHLAAVGADMKLHRYTLDGDELVAQATTQVTRSFTADECRRFMPQGACPSTP